jgi:hypothetical protein
MEKFLNSVAPWMAILLQWYQSHLRNHESDICFCYVIIWLKQNESKVKLRSIKLHICDICNPNAKYIIYDIVFSFRSFKPSMIVFLWAINGRLLLDPTLVWWSNDVLINHTELTIETCLTVWNWCIRVSDGTRVVLSESYAIGVWTHKSCAS